ncbi:hypothetical protein H9636_02275 [Ureibacillus sp. Re31]|uniref:Transposase n=1 Tax=Ureibacillus galli TaxID=2762222 RepID=A0ABR8X838_9BACL|nr:hypothetical protein [Ureibacillus galli]
MIGKFHLLLFFKLAIPFTFYQCALTITHKTIELARSFLKKQCINRQWLSLHTRTVYKQSLKGF